MTHQFRDKDIDEIFLSVQNKIVHVTYLGPTEQTFYTRKDLQQLMDILDGKEEGVRRK